MLGEEAGSQEVALDPLEAVCRPRPSLGPRAGPGASPDPPSSPSSLRASLSPEAQLVTQKSRERGG